MRHSNKSVLFFKNFVFQLINKYIYLYIYIYFFFNFNLFKKDIDLFSTVSIYIKMYIYKI